MDVSIIYVNWKSEDYIKESIDSVYEHTHGLQFEIIVVDNASPSGNVDMLKEQFPEITVIKTGKNLGFAGANNVGFQNSSGEFALFLNPDTKLLNPAINAMVNHLRNLPDGAIIGCKLLNADLSVQTSCIQTFPTILNQILDADVLRNRWPNSRLWGIRPLYSESSEPAEVEMVSGACLMMKHAAFEKVSMFCEEYFMYAEDADLCYKAVRAGYKNYYTGEGTVLHYGGKSSESDSATRMKWRAVAMFCDKHYGRMHGIAFRAALASAAMGRLAVIRIACAFGDRLGPQAQLRSALRKWRTILNVLVSPSVSN